MVLKGGVVFMEEIALGLGVFLNGGGDFGKGTVMYWLHGEEDGDDDGVGVLRLV